MAKVYYFDFSNTEIKNDFRDVLKERYEYISKIFDKNRKKQSYFASKLLEFAFAENNIDYSCGLSCKSGEWFLKNNSAYFSISHSNNMVVVAISKDKIGVDVENIDKKVLALEKKYNLNKRFNSSNEKIEEYTKFWVENESRFKAKIDGQRKLLKVNDGKDNLYLISVVYLGEVEFIKVNNF